MKKRKPKSLQQISDFCKLDATYNEYYNIPDSYQCKSREQYRYYYQKLSEHGVSRSGTYIFHQSLMQLYRFLGVKPDWCADSLLFFIDKDTLELANREDYRYPGDLIYIRCHIRRKGVHIEFSHPFNRMKDIQYWGRSHQPYTEEGVRQDVINYINKHLLFPPGRYRDLQVENQIYKEDFIRWYKYEYLPGKKKQEEWDYFKMLDRFDTTVKTSWDDCYNLLDSFGVFEDSGADEFERDRMTEDFYNIMNR